MKHADPLQRTIVAEARAYRLEKRGVGVSHVMHVTELQRLLDELVLARDVRRAREDDGEQDRAGVGALMEYLRHRFGRRDREANAR